MLFMNNLKSKKINKKLFFILAILVLIWLSLIIFSFFREKDDQSEIITNKSTWVKEFKKDSKTVKLFNQILSSSIKYDDYKKCEEIKNKDLKENCIAQIKFMFDEINQAKNADDCKKLVEKDGKTATERQDICFLNLNYRLAKWVEWKKWCEEIKNKDIKSLCIAQNNLISNKK